MLKNKTALITGSLGGIGFATAKALAAQGCNIMLNGFADADVIRDRQAELGRAYNVHASYHGADLRFPDQIEQLVKTTAETLGGVDIVVNNAVVRTWNPIDKFRTEDWDAAIAVNLSASFHTIRLGLPYMKQASWGRIVNMGSTFSLFGVTDRVDYVTTKTGLIGLTRAVALEVAKAGITCNAICPGQVLTPATEGRVQAEMLRDGTPREAILTRLSARQPVGRFIDDADVAALIAFLCGPHGRDINGATLPIDGAWSAGRS
jgi:3-hydroxybutyrate dehydrogenase